MERLSPKQKALKRKHGTPDEFAEACKQCLGEISLSEMEAAITKYRDEWAKAGWETHWLKITIQLKPEADIKALSWAMTQRFEEEFKVPALYFARYVDMQSSRFEISAFVADDQKAIKKHFRKHKAVLSVTIVNRDPGSNAHACAYQAVKRLPDRVGDFADDKELLDVVHWMCNMRGYDYMREIRFYAYSAVVFADMIAKQNDRALDNVLLKMIRERGKAQSSAKAGKASPQSAPAKSAPAAAGKGHATNQKKSARSNR